MIPWAPTSLYYDRDRGGGTIGDLILRRGQIQADQAARSGEIWSNAISRIGETVGGAIKEHGEKKEAKKRDIAISESIGAWDGQDPNVLLKDLTRIAGPEMGPRLAQTALSVHAMTGKGDAKDEEYALNLAKAIERGDIPDEVLQRHGPAIQSKLAGVAKNRLGVTDEMLAQPWGPDQFREGAKILTAMAGGGEKGAPKTREIKTRNADGSETVRIVEDKPGFETTSAAEPVTPSYQSKDMLLDGKLTPVNFDSKSGKYFAGDQDVSARVKPVPPGFGNVRGGLTDNAEASIVNRLTNQWDKANQEVRDLNRQVSVMRSGLAAAKAGNMNAGSQAVIATYNKILDPTSTVRESEYARTAEGQSLRAQIEGYYTKLEQGGAGLTIQELESMAKLGEEFVRKAASSEELARTKDRIGFSLDHYKIDRRHVFGAEQEDAPPKPAGGTSPKKANPFR